MKTVLILSDNVYFLALGEKFLSLLFKGFGLEDISFKVVKSFEEIKPANVDIKILYLLNGTWYPSKTLGEVTGDTIKTFDIYYGAQKGSSKQCYEQVVLEIFCKLAETDKDIPSYNKSRNLFHEVLESLAVDVEEFEKTFPPKPKKSIEPINNYLTLCGYKIKDGKFSWMTQEELENFLK